MLVLKTKTLFLYRKLNFDKRRKQTYEIENDVL